MFRAPLNRRLAAVLLVLASGFAPSAGAAEQIALYAAASATDAVQDLAARYEKEQGVKVVTSFAAPSALAKQIEQGAPADVFISADSKWMDYLDGQGKIIQASRRNLLGNRLVLIAPKGKAFPVKLEKGFDLPGAFEGRWCSCDASVPIGQYARQALTALGWWAALEPRLAATPDVRSALAFVERGECAVGIVYETDAKRSDKVEALGVFPADTHAPVRYPAALVRGGQPAARGFLDFLRTAAAAEVFRRYGFTVLD
ncbi:MAG: molybdate ABC transporter substrate-binding protein [Candidatus Competibacteraceae bacterium]|nr:molybdate ABC transporter substrate-binding protein [Candidatus Competibacteraceae bacterium]